MAEQDDIGQQVDIRRATYRVMHQGPGHTTYGFWVNGGKAGELTVRNEEVVGFQQLISHWTFTELDQPHPMTNER